jgi:trk system potassium uptake protein TrkA
MRILIVGAGDIGFQLSKRLSQDGYDITMVEVDAKRIRRVSDQLDVMLVEGSGTSYRFLKQADVLAAMTTSDEVHILACRLAKKAGVAITMARVRNPEFTDPDFVLSPQEMGVDVVIHPEKETADAVVRLIRQSSANYAIEFEEGKVQIVGVRLDDHSTSFGAVAATLSNIPV